MTPTKLSIACGLTLLFSSSAFCKYKCSISPYYLYNYLLFILAGHFILVCHHGFIRILLHYPMKLIIYNLCLYIVQHFCLVMLYYFACLDVFFWLLRYHMHSRLISHENVNLEVYVWFYTYNSLWPELGIKLSRRLDLIKNALGHRRIISKFKRP